MPIAIKKFLHARAWIRILSSVQVDIEKIEIRIHARASNILFIK